MKDFRNHKILRYLFIIYKEIYIESGNRPVRRFPLILMHNYGLRPENTGINGKTADSARAVICIMFTEKLSNFTLS